MSALLRQKLIVAIDGQDEKLLPAPKNFLLFLPEGEYHELGLLFGHYMIKSAGHRVLYLGANMPLENLESVNHHYHPDFILTSLTSALAVFDQTEFIFQLSQKFPSAFILATGEQLLNATHEKTVHYIRSPDDLKKFF
jgi:methanogenic corrinoid protein MtbC1